MIRNVSCRLVSLLFAMLLLLRLCLTFSQMFMRYNECPCFGSFIVFLPFDLARELIFDVVHDTALLAVTALTFCSGSVTAQCQVQR